MDIISFHENEAVFSEILQMVTDNFYNDFDIENIIVKATPEDIQRVVAVANNNFDKLKDNNTIPYNDYYIRRK